MPKIEKATKDELIAIVEDLTEQVDLREARLRVLEERMSGAKAMIEKIDRMIVRMNGQSTPYRDELESVVTEYGFWIPRGEATGESSSHGG